MKWDAKKRQYLDDSGRVIPASQIRTYIDEYIAKEQRDIDREAKRLFAGAVTLTAFFQFIRLKIANWHTTTGVIAYGGQSQMTPERWQRINSKILSELTYLNRFEREAQASFSVAETIARHAVAHLSKDIPAGLESVVQERIAEALLTAAPSEVETVVQKAIVDALADSLGAQEAEVVAQSAVVDKASAMLDQLIGGTIPNRAGMYAEASYSTYQNNVKQRESEFGATGVRRVCAEDEASCDDCVSAATEEYVGLDEISDIGTLTCMNNCRCDLQFSYHGVEPLTIDRELVTENILTA